MKKSGFLKPTLILFAITAITALLLGVVNAVTQERIAENKLLKTEKAMLSVMPEAAGFSELDPIIEITEQHRIYAAEDKNGAVIGHVVQVSPNGFGGAIELVVGIIDGAVTDVSIIDMSETAGLGTKAGSEAWFLEQFSGKSGQLAIKQDVDAISGATVTSSAITKGVNTALQAVVKLEGLE